MPAKFSRYTVFDILRNILQNLNARTQLLASAQTRFLVIPGRLASKHITFTRHLAK